MSKIWHCIVYRVQGIPVSFHQDIIHILGSKAEKTMINIKMVYYWYTNGIRTVYGGIRLDLGGIRWYTVVYGWILGWYTVVYGGIRWYTAGSWGGIRMVYGWYTGGIRMVYGWYTDGIRMVYGWYMDGIPLIYTEGIRLVYRIGLLLVYCWGRLNRKNEHKRKKYYLLRLDSHNQAFQILLYLKAQPQHGTIPSPFPCPL